MRDSRDASQRILVSACRRVARQRQSQHEFDWLALLRETLNNLISYHYYNFFNVSCLSFLHLFSNFSCLFRFFYFISFVYSCPLLPFIFSHFHDCFILHFAPSFYIPFDRQTHTQCSAALVMIFRRCQLYIILLLTQQWDKSQRCS